MDWRNLENSQKLLRLIVSIVGVIISVIVAEVLFNSNINLIAASCMLVSVFAFSVCVISPKSGVYTLVLVSGYLDFVKRCLIMFGDFSLTDITMVLIIAPLMVGALFLSLFTGYAFHRVRFSWLDVGAIFAAFMAVGLGFYISARDVGVNAEAIKETINGTCYAFMLPVITNTFSKPGELTKLFRFAVIVYIPVAVYGIWQQIFGLNDFEIAYLQSGFTVTADILLDVRPRPFSTLNSPTSLAGMTAMMAILSLVPMWAKEGQPQTATLKVRCIFLFLLFIAACICSLSRAGSVVWMIGLAALYFFETKTRTKIFYGVTIGAFVLLVLLSPFLLDHLGDIDLGQYANSDFSWQALRMGTYAERLKGYINLTHSTAMWSPFGLSSNELNSELVYNHDMFSSMLIYIGFIPMGIIIFICYKALSFAHGRLLRMPQGDRRSLLMIMIALMYGCIAVPVLAGAGFMVAFPDNLYFWLFAGSLAMLLLKKTEDENPPLEVVQKQPPALRRRRTKRPTIVKPVA
ncbi:MAG: hypothetical protein QM796_06175 [Chthoniobacteraceae bacterium]